MKSRFLPGRCYWLLLAAVAAGPPAAAQDMCAGDHATALVVENGVALVPVQINTRQGDYFFLVDTGADATLIDVTVATALDLPRGSSVEILGGYGSRAVFASSLELLKVGSVHVPALRVLVDDLSELAATLDAELHGILGVDVLSRSPFTLDYPNHCAWFPADSRPSDGSALRLKHTDQGYLVPIVINETSRDHLLLDTGSSMTHLRWPLWERIAKETTRAPKLVGGFVTATQSDAHSYLTRLESIRVGGATIREPVVRLLQIEGSGAFAEPGVSGVLGGDILERFRVTFDLARSRLLLEPAPAYRPDPLRFTSVGIQVLRRPAGFVVAAVWGGGPAEKAQVAVGDEILEVDGTPVAGWSGTRVVDALRGPEGTEVTVRLRRGEETILRTLRRERLL